MNPQKPSSSRHDRLSALLREQSHVLRSRVRRRNAGLVATMVLLVGSVAWLVSPRQQPAQPNPTTRHASASGQNTPGTPEPEPSAPADAPFGIARIADRPLTMTTIVQNTEPSRVEYISDLQLFLAMREQGIDAGLIRIGGRTQLAFNDEESRRRFERGPGSAE